ncbi:MAG: ABC transporter ATP-binding protein [Massilioclostridium sp.]|nr:ABC transporter ATP-binding protein [Massilioclostridium sp.]
MIQVENLTKRYGNQLALQGISFEVEQGEILGFLGPNGAGKSTTMNILTGYISSTGGRVCVNGFDLLEQPNQAKACIGYLPEQPPLYFNMTVQEYLNFVWDLKKVRGNKRKEIFDICKTVKIDHVYERVIGNLSKGYRQRVGLAQALIGNPEVLILDEPTVGLDPQQIIDIRNLIRDLGRQHTIILSSHILTEIQAVCDRIIVISDGRIVADDTEENLSKSLSGEYGYTLRAEGEEDTLRELVESVPGVGRAEVIGSREPGTVDFLIEPEGEEDIRRPLFHAFAQAGIPILGLKSNELSLEDIFLRLVAGEGQGEQTPEAEGTAEQQEEPSPDVLQDGQTDSAQAGQSEPLTDQKPYSVQIQQPSQQSAEVNDDESNL